VKPATKFDSSHSQIITNISVCRAELHMQSNSIILRQPTHAHARTHTAYFAHPWATTRPLQAKQSSYKVPRSRSRIPLSEVSIYSEPSNWSLMWRCHRVKWASTVSQAIEASYEDTVEWSEHLQWAKQLKPRVKIPPSEVGIYSEPSNRSALILSGISPLDSI
jgi:hypothetical protein